jgi:NAD-dependent deacetylase
VKEESFFDSTPFSSAVSLLKRSRKIVAFTGAGISAESGLPVFRGPGGIWEEVDVEEFGTPWGIGRVLREAPERLFIRLKKVAEQFFNALPNPAHIALGRGEEEGIVLGVVTQNVDDLHEQGGTKTIFKLHGDLLKWRCIRCGKKQKWDRDDLYEKIRSLFSLSSLQDILSSLPRCSCSSLMRPDVVLFGEPLPVEEIEGAERLLREGDCLLIVGTSGVVEPAASLARMAIRRGIPAIEINREPSLYSSSLSVSLFGKAGDILPALFSRAFSLVS